MLDNKMGQYTMKLSNNPEDKMCRHLERIKYLLYVLVFCTIGTILLISITAVVFRTQVTELNGAETNQFLSDLFTMAANGRSASNDAPVLMRSAASIADMTAQSMSDNNSTSVADMMDTISSVMTEENLKMLSTAIADIPWQETVIPLASQLLRNTENMERILMLVISALQQQNQPEYVVTELKS